MFNQSRQDQAPFRSAGLVGLNQYMQMLGLGGNALGQQYTGANTGGTGAGADFVTMQNGVPSMNSSLYVSDPNYKRAWDQAVAEHQAKYGKPYQYDSSAANINTRVSSLYNSYKPQVGSVGYEKATPANNAASQQDAFAAFRNTPGYQFGLDEGAKTVQASAAARGGLNSGATLKALTKFGNDYADQQGYTPYMNKLAALSGMA